MLNFGFSSVLISVLSCNVLLIFMAVIFRHPSVILRIGFRMLTIFAVLTAIRFLFPFELPITTNINLPEQLSRMVIFLRHPRFSLSGTNISIWNLFEIVWAVGFFILLTRYIKEYSSLYCAIKRYGTDLTAKVPYCTLLQEICNGKNRCRRIRILQVPFLQTPMVCKFWVHYILLPENLELEESDLSFILHHEASHIFHHDLLMKFLIQMVCMIYWWNPFCYLLKKQTNLLLESRIDQSITSFDPNVKVAYLECLLKISEQISQKYSPSVPTGIAFSGRGTSLLYKRFRLLTESDSASSKKSMSLLLIPVCAIYLFSFFYIFEAHYMPPETKKTVESLSSENTYIVPNGDGTYTVYYQGIFVETTDSLKYYPEDCNIYSSQEEASIHEKN